MARRGLRYVAFGKLDKTNGTYSDGRWLGASAQISGTADVQVVDDYGDGGKREHGEWLRGGTLTWECVSDSDEIGSYLLGHAVNSDGEQVVGVDDVAPPVGVAIITRTDGDGWAGKFYPHVEFRLPDETEQTERGGQVIFAHASLKGTIFVYNKTFRLRKTFASFADAAAWARAKVGMATDDGIDWETSG